MALINSLAGPDFGRAGTGVFLAGGTALAIASRTMRR
jgi:hypothetical protein